MYRLKNNAADFAVVDGRFAGRSYRAGEAYEEIPPEEKNKFERIESAEERKSGSQEEKASGPAAAPKEGGKK